METSIKELRNDTEKISSHLKDYSNELTEYKRDAQDYFWLLGTGADIKHVKLIRYVPVRAYISDPVPKRATLNNLVESIEKLVAEFGFDKTDEFPEEDGSWWKKLVLKTKEAMTQKEVADRLEKVERAAEIAYLDKPQAEANQCQAQAASALITSLKDTNNACIQVGSLLVVKATDNNSGKKDTSIIARTLTPMELKHLEENQAILRKPAEILDWLQNIQKKRLSR